MAQSLPIKDEKIYQGTAAASGGTFIADYTVPIDTTARLRAWVSLSASNAAHQNAGGSLCAEYVVQNQNGTLSAPIAISGSVNPNNSDTVDVTSLSGDTGVQASDTAFSNVGGGFFPSARWTISGTSARLTVTNQSVTSIVANVTVWIEVKIVGST